VNFLAVGIETFKDAFCAGRTPSVKEFRACYIEMVLMLGVDPHSQFSHVMSLCIFCEYGATIRVHEDRPAMRMGPPLANPSPRVRSGPSLAGEKL
jgi:hypothetical protein